MAAQWRTDPDLIVVSRYSRTAYTAAALCKKHPQVPVVELPVHELTFLAPGRYIGTTETTRREPARQYWERCDPDFCDGEGAETFRHFCERIDASVQVLRERAEQRIAVFCHAYVIKAILWRQLHPEAPSTADYMRGFFDFHLNCVVPNVMVYPFESAEGEVLKMLSPFQIEMVG